MINGATVETDPLLLQFLATSEVKCPVCRYDLCGCLKRCCPECGHRLELVLKPEARPRSWFLVGMSGLAAGLGMNLSILLVFVIAAPLSDVARFIPSMVSAPLFAILSWSCHRRWASLARLEFLERAGFIALTWSLTGASVFWFLWRNF